MNFDSQTTTNIVLIILSCGIGALGYFMRRLIAQNDALVARQAAAENRITVLEGGHGSHAREIERVGQEIVGCRRSHDGKSDDVRRDLAELRGMMLTMATGQAGVLAAIEGVEKRLAEGNERFASQDTITREHERRISTLEGHGK